LKVVNIFLNDPKQLTTLNKENIKETSKWYCSTAVLSFVYFFPEPAVLSFVYNVPRNCSV